jgi:hypothetical protein
LALGFKVGFKRGAIRAAATAFVLTTVPYPLEGKTAEFMRIPIGKPDLDLASIHVIMVLKNHLILA